MNYSYSPYWNDPYYGYDWYGTGALSEVTPLGVLVPPMGVAQAFGIAPKGFGSIVPRGLGSASGSSKSGTADMASIAPPKPEFRWFGVAVIVGIGALGALLIYSASSAAEKYVGPVQKFAGRAAGSVAGARYGKSAGALARLGNGRKIEVLPAHAGDTGNYKLLTA